MGRAKAPILIQFLCQKYNSNAMLARGHTLAIHNTIRINNKYQNSLFLSKRARATHTATSHKQKADRNKQQSGTTNHERSSRFRLASIKKKQEAPRPALSISDNTCVFGF